MPPVLRIILLDGRYLCLSTVEITKGAEVAI